MQTKPVFFLDKEVLDIVVLGWRLDSITLNICSILNDFMNAMETSTDFIISQAKCMFSFRILMCAILLLELGIITQTTGYHE